MGKPLYNFGNTANLKAQQRKQMDRDLKRRIAKQSKVHIKSGSPDKESDTAEPGKAANIADGAA